MWYFLSLLLSLLFTTEDFKMCKISLLKDLKYTITKGNNSCNKSYTVRNYWRNEGLSVN